MKKLNLKQILTMENIKKGIKANLFITKEEMENAVAKTLKSDKDNSISVETVRNGETVDFENTLHVDEAKQLYLLESRAFRRANDSMINGYLEVIDNNGEIISEEIDDVWTYADWRKVN